MATDDYTPSKKTRQQRRRASRKSGATAKTSDVLDTSLLAISFKPEFEDDPALIFRKTLEAIRSGDPAPYDAIEACYVALIQSNLEVVAQQRAVAKTEEDALTLNLHLVAVRELQSCLKTFRASRGKTNSNDDDPIENAMQKKLSRLQMQRALDVIN